MRWADSQFLEGSEEKECALKRLLSEGVGCRQQSRGGLACVRATRLLSVGLSSGPGFPSTELGVLRLASLSVLVYSLSVICNKSSQTLVASNKKL